MKRWYQLHLLSLVMLLFIGGYFIYDYHREVNEFFSRYEDAEMVFYPDWFGFSDDVGASDSTREYAICSLFLFAFSVFIGWKTMGKLRKIGIVLVIGGIVFFCWSILMIRAPSHISLNEVFPAWIVYVVVASGLTIYGMLWHENKSILIRGNYQEDILDDDMGA